MKRTEVKITRPTPEEEREIAAQLAEDPDSYKWTDEDWASAKTTQELFPELAEASRKRREDLTKGLLEHVTITLDRETIAWFKSQTGEDGETGGTAWLALIEQTLQSLARNPQN